MKRVLALLSAVGDSGFAAIGTFVAGFVAVLNFTPNQLALYSLVFAGTVAAGVVPRQLTLIPSRTHANLHDPRSALRLSRDIKAAGWPFALAIGVVIVSGLPMAMETPLPWVAVTSTAICSLVLGAIQEHARAVLHMLKKHHVALFISIGGAAITTISCFGGLFLAKSATAPEWTIALVPFGGLALGYAAAVPVYLLSTRRLSKSNFHFLGSLHHRFGYLWTAFLIQSVGYATNYLVLAIIGTQALATFESARVFAAPILVIGTGLGNALKPRIIEAIGNKNPTMFRRRMIQLGTATIGFGVPFVVASGVLAAWLGPTSGRAMDGALTAARAASFVPESLAGNLGAVHLAAGETRKWTTTTTWITAAELITLPVGLMLLGTYGPPAVHALSTGARALIGTRAVWNAAGPEDDTKG